MTISPRPNSRTKTNRQNKYHKNGFTRIDTLTTLILSFYCRHVLTTYLLFLTVLHPDGPGGPETSFGYPVPHPTLGWSGLLTEETLNHSTGLVTGPSISVGSERIQPGTEISVPDSHSTPPTTITSRDPCTSDSSPSSTRHPPDGLYSV